MAGQVFQELKKHGILIKNLDGSHPLAEKLPAGDGGNAG